jgi:hypothetical protein
MLAAVLHLLYVLQVKHTVGINRMQRLLPDCLMRSARGGLRWSGQLRKLSMYLAVLLKVCAVYCTCTLEWYYCWCAVCTVYPAVLGRHTLWC